LDASFSKGIKRLYWFYPQFDIVPVEKGKVMLCKWKIKRKKAAKIDRNVWIYWKNACILAEVAHNLNLIYADSIKEICI